MTNLRTDEIVFFRNLTKIGTDENKAIYSSPNTNSDIVYNNLLTRRGWLHELFVSSACNAFIHIGVPKYKQNITG